MSQVREQVKNAQAVRAAAGGTFGQTKAQANGTEGKPTLPLVVGPAHYAWMQRPSRERVYSEKAIEFGLKVMRGEDYVPRGPGEFRFAPSSLSEAGRPQMGKKAPGCSRRALFHYANAPKAPEEVKSQDMMDGGSWLHLKWQMEGLSAGWLDEAENYRVVDWRGKQLVAKIDGLGSAVGIFELKTKGKWVMADVAEAPMWEHEMQFEAYCMVFEIDYGSLVYLDRDTAAFKEYRLAADATRRLQLERVLEDLSGWIDLDLLPDMLEECEKRDGPVYRRCPYREICPAAEKVSTVGALRR